MTSVKLIIMSHLSDITEMLGQNQDAEIQNRINFIKYLTLTHVDSTKRIDADVEYANYQLKNSKNSLEVSN